MHDAQGNEQERRPTAARAPALTSPLSAQAAVTHRACRLPPASAQDFPFLETAQASLPHPGMSALTTAPVAVVLHVSCFLLVVLEGPPHTMRARLSKGTHLAGRGPEAGADCKQEALEGPSWPSNGPHGPSPPPSEAPEVSAHTTVTSTEPSGCARTGWLQAAPPGGCL